MKTLSCKDKVEIWNAAYGAAFAMELARCFSEKFDCDIDHQLIAAKAVAVAVAAVVALEKLEKLDKGKS